jgi:hypothetical protein
MPKKQNANQKYSDLNDDNSGLLLLLLLLLLDSSCITGGAEYKSSNLTEAC